MLKVSRLTKRSTYVVFIVALSLCALYIPLCLFRYVPHAHFCSLFLVFVRCHWCVPFCTCPVIIRTAAQRRLFRICVLSSPITLYFTSTHIFRTHPFLSLSVTNTARQTYHPWDNIRIYFCLKWQNIYTRRGSVV